jgi:hypothetical protein
MPNKFLVTYIRAFSVLFRWCLAKNWRVTRVLVGQQQPSGRKTATLRRLQMAAALTRGAKGTVRPAGVKNYGADESSSAALDFSGRPSTPERLARFRMPQEPGTRVRPGGPMREDAVDTDRFYGTFGGRGKTAGEALDRSKTKLEEYAEVRPLRQFCRYRRLSGII